MEKKTDQKIRQRTAWFQEQWKDNRFRVFCSFVLTAGIGIAAEFTFFSYSIWKIISYLILFGALSLTAWIDRRNRRIPNRILKCLLAVRGILLLLEWLTSPKSATVIWLPALLGALLGGGLLLPAHFLSGGGMGMGDIKLFAVIGAYMGSGSILYVVFLSLLSGAAYCVVMLVFKKINRKERIPFAPFIFIGTMLAMVLGM